MPFPITDLPTFPIPMGFPWEWEFPFPCTPLARTAFQRAASQQICVFHVNLSRSVRLQDGKVAAHLNSVKSTPSLYTSCVFPPSLSTPAISAPSPSGGRHRFVVQCFLTLNFTLYLWCVVQRAMLSSFKQKPHGMKYIYSEWSEQHIAQWTILRTKKEEISSLC